jgi:hypothetical protein
MSTDEAGNPIGDPFFAEPGDEPGGGPMPEPEPVDPIILEVQFSSSCN